MKLEQILKLENFQILFGLLSVSGSIMTLLAKDLFRAAFGLLLSLLSVAGLFVLAHAEFLGGSQIIIYIGGILILLLFGIFLSTQAQKSLLNIPEVLNWPTTAVVLGLGGIMFWALLQLQFTHKLIDASFHIKNLGFYLLTQALLPFELIGVVLLMALIGALFIAKK